MVYVSSSKAVALRIAIYLQPPSLGDAASFLDNYFKGDLAMQEKGAPCEDACYDLTSSS